MSNAEHIALVDRLRREPTECEWLEFKRNRYEPQDTGRYLSALANGAGLRGRPRGYLLFGIDDTTHEVIGTDFDPYQAKGQGNQDLMLWLALGLQPNNGLDVYVVPHPDGRVVVFDVAAAWDRPVQFYGVAWIRVGSSLTELSKHPDRQRTLWSRRADWSAEVCERATLADLDPDALQKARAQYAIKFPDQAGRLSDWDDRTFLNKAKLTIDGGITHAALVLLGRSEVSGLLSPALAWISWLLKDGQNRDLDYQHFGPPFLLQVDRVLARIRNLTVRALPSGTLFPVELSQYDPWVLREALHNCIAHQDYRQPQRIQVVESPTWVLLTNGGSFLAGSVEEVIRRDAPVDTYRNPFLAQAMVNLNMIDTQGGGIKRMFQSQVRRSFPLPDYDLSDPARVVVRIRGEILDERYTRLLLERGDLDLWQVILLDKIQKRVPIGRDDHRRLKAAGLVEGRYPNLMVAARVAKATGHAARHIREKGLDRDYYLNLILRLVEEHGPVTRQDIDRLLMDKLPEILSEEQKKHRIHHMLTRLVRDKRISNTGSRSRPFWTLCASVAKQQREPGG